ncbi:MAG TPA: methyltransferase domain-containing protein [Longimicrobiales bacterium]
MKERLLPYLACPHCSSDLVLDVTSRTGHDIMEGSLTCTTCHHVFAIRRGVPRFTGGVTEVEERTAAAFGYEWTRYAELADRYRKQFLDWIEPVTPDFFRGKAVLEGGCGKGRHTVLAAEFGAKDVVAVDLGEAVEAAFANTRHLDNVHIVQADLNNPPVRPHFDYAFSVGVLHHLPDPERGFRALVSRVRPGGAISAWVYGREGNGWIVHGVTPIREHVTSHLPHSVLDALSGALTVPLWLGTKLLYGPTDGKVLGRPLPYGAYLSYIAPFPFREQRSIVFDHLVTPIAFYISRPEFESWFAAAGLQNVRIEQHNGNSWRGFARVPMRAA